MEETEEQIEALSEESVVKYLLKTPTFFANKNTLLASMKISHANDKLVLLQEQQMAELRTENQKLQRQLEYLIGLADENNQLNQRVKRLVVALTHVSGMDEFFHALYSTLCNEFNTDTVVMRCFQSPTLIGTRQEFVEYDAQIFTLFENLLNSDQPISGQKVSTEQIEYLFPNSKIASVVLIPLGTPEQQGLLAMGSHDVSRFKTDMNTDLLKYLAEIVSNLLNVWLRQ